MMEHQAQAAVGHALSIPQTPLKKAWKTFLGSSYMPRDSSPAVINEAPQALP